MEIRRSKLRSSECMSFGRWIALFAAFSSLCDASGTLSHHLRSAPNSSSIRDTQDELELALAIASLDPESGQKQPIMMVMVEDRMARLHFPIFLQSLVDVGVAQRLIVFVLDQQAHKICHKIHREELCVSRFGAQNVQSVNVPVMYDENNGVESWHHKGWMKTSLTLKALLLNHTIMFMDVDMLAFHDPFKAVHPDAEVAASLDCQDEYTPYPAMREHGSPNLGITFFRSTPLVIEIVIKWLDKRHPDKWDQMEFKYIIESAVDAHPELKVQMLSRDEYPVLCCQYCNNLLRPLVRREWGWQDHCPREQRDKWIVFHATCINSWREVKGVEYDEVITKQDIMYMIKDLKEQDKLKSEL